MLKLLKTTLVIFIVMGASCTYLQTSTLNPSTGTSVVLSQKNFKVLGSVQGYADVYYFFFIPIGKENVLTRAREDMISKCRINNSSKAIANLTVDKEINGFYPLFYKSMVNVSGELVEFLDTTKDKYVASKEIKTQPLVKTGMLCEIITSQNDTVKGIVDIRNEVYTVVVNDAGKKVVIKSQDIINCKTLE
jgi:hypothetical protein